jgi:hypothetical protein
MEKHPLESWDQWVHSELHPVVLLQSAQETPNGYLAMAKELKGALKTQLLRDTLYNKTEKEIELLVERYQIKVAGLLNLLFQYQQEESITPGLKFFFGAVAGELETIIVLLQNDYGRYFNWDLDLPLSLRLRKAHEIKKQWKLLFKTLSERETNIHLVNVLDQSIKGLHHLQDGPAISYRQASYLKNLLKELSGYLSAPTSPSVYTSLTELLISWKFNDFAFIREVFSDIRIEMEKKESDECRLEFLRGFRKQLTQLLEKNLISFHAAQPTAKQVILDWMGQELAYLQVMVALPEKKEAQEEVKMHTSLSVPVLAGIARLFKDSGMITNSNHTEILKFFTSHFATQQKGEFSYDHLRTRYYNVEEGTKKKVYDYLMVLGQLCKKL